MTPIRALPALGALMVLAGTLACGRRATSDAASPATAARRCELAPEDSARLVELSAALGVRVYERCEVDRAARRLSAFFRRPTDVRPTATQPCLEVALEFVVAATGRVFPAPVVATATNSTPFAREVVGRHREWRFTPARLGGAAVAQLVRDTAYFAFVPSVGGRPVQTTDRPRCNRY